MRKQLLLGTMVLGSMLTGSPLLAQEQIPFCGTDAQQQKIYAEHPELREDYLQFLQNNVTVKKEGEVTRFIYKIPVVFHILHEYGTENISDAEVYNQMQVLNQDYRKLNPEISQIIPEFAGIAADCQIEFQLATLDPWGNCTNGIEHIYTHLTNSGDNFSKVNQWHRSQYLNVWVCKSFDEPGLQAFSLYPTTVNGSLFYADGVIMLHSAVGSHTLTHELGHWMGLPHTWGDTNDPAVECGDDGINDTPETMGHWTCDLDDDHCNPGTIENVQNYMEYSGCNIMFTEGQKSFMTNSLLAETANRNNLWTEETHTATGINVIPAPTCIPEADFSSDKRMACVGDPIQLKDASWRAGVTSFQWDMPGATPATSTAANPIISYSAPGYYSVTLTVSNAAGSDTKTFTNMIYVSGSWPEFTGPFVDDYEGPSAGWWIVQNPENNFGRFELTENAGKDLSTCYALKSYRDISQADPFTNDWFYDYRLGGSKDYLISPAYDLSNTSNVSISFDYAYGTGATTLNGVTEILKVYSSKDCGATWQLRSNATLDGADLLTVGYVGDNDFVPESNTEWKTQTFTYQTTSQDTKTRFRFEFLASDNSNNLYIDNINISGVLGISEQDGTNALVSVAPNPVAAGGTISVVAGSGDGDLSLELVDVNGALVSVTNVTVNGTETIEIPAPAAKGCYFLNAVRGNTRSTNRIIVF